MPYLCEDRDGTVLLTLYVQPRASRDAVAGRHGDAVKICITAPPVDGKANTAVARFLARLFELPKTAVVLQSGQQSRRKRFRLEGLSLTEARRILEASL